MARKPGDTREKLLETAITLIWQSSYAQVGVSEICARAGVTKGGFYHYFPAKSALFAAACDHYWAKIHPELDALFSPVNSARQQLEGLISYMLAKQGLDPDCPVSGCPFFTAGAQAGADDDDIRKAALVMVDRALCYYTLLLRNLQSEGLLTADRDPQIWARILCQYVQGLLLHGRIHRDIDLVQRDLRIGLYALLGVGFDKTS